MPCPSTNGWIGKCDICIYINMHNAVLITKKNEIMSFPEKWMK
jgi:hypothetical protein